MPDNYSSTPDNVTVRHLMLAFHKNRKINGQSGVCTPFNDSLATHYS